MNLNRRIARLEHAAAARAEESPRPADDPMQLVMSDVTAYELYCRLADHREGAIDLDRLPLGQFIVHLTEAEEAEVTRALEERLALLRAALPNGQREPRIGVAGRSRERRRRPHSGW